MVKVPGGGGGGGGGVPEPTDTLAEAFLVVLATLVAVTVTEVVVLTLGAVNKPLAETDPALADHVTPVWLVLRTVAENCCDPPDATVALVGETATLMMLPDSLPPTAICVDFWAVRPALSLTATTKL
jgi:hypothetical protein